MSHTEAVLEFAAVVNPTAGGGRAGAQWADLVRRVPELAAAHLIQAADAEGVRREVVAVIERGVTRVVVFGGDGSMHLVCNAVLDLGRGGDVALGMVPLGTGSDLPRALGLPSDVAECAARVVRAVPRTVDALELTTADGRRRWIVNVASAGLSGMVDEAVNAMPHRGASAYLRATIQALLHYRPVACRVHADGELWYEGEIYLLAAANGTSFGRGMQVAPRARLDDGEMDVILIQPAPLWKLLFRLVRLYKGTHLEADFVRWRRARTLDLEVIGGMPPFDLDGEVFPSASARIRVAPGALRLLA